MIDENGEPDSNLNYNDPGSAKPPKRCAKCGNLVTRFDSDPVRCRQCIAIEELQEFTRQQQEEKESTNETTI